MRIVAALLRKEATVSDLAARLELGVDSVSWHLGVLRAAHLVSTRRWGRLVSYRLDAGRINPSLAALHHLPRRRNDRPAHPRALASRRGGLFDLRQARMCYDHLAGGSGVHVLKALLDRAWLVQKADGKRPRYALNGRGVRALSRRGVNVLRAYRARRVFAYGCADWQEPHRHLGGALGAEILAALLHAGVLDRVGRSRRFVWRRPIAAWLPEERRGLIRGWNRSG